MCVCRRKLDEMISDEDVANGKEKCYFAEKKCLSDIHKSTSLASRSVNRYTVLADIPCSPIDRARRYTVRKPFPPMCSVNRYICVRLYHTFPYQPFPMSVDVFPSHTARKSSLMCCIQQRLACSFRQLTALII